MCQALYVLNLAEPDEERFFRRMRADSPAAAQAPLDLRRLVSRCSSTRISIRCCRRCSCSSSRRSSPRARSPSRRWATIRATPSTSLRARIPIAQTLYYAASVLGIAPPPAFQNTNDPGGLWFLHAHDASDRRRTRGARAQIAPQAAAFIVARHLAYFRPGFYVRHLVPTGTGLKAWLFAAIKMISPQFPIQRRARGPMRESMAALERAI